MSWEKYHNGVTVSAGKIIQIVGVAAAVAVGVSLIVGAKHVAAAVPAAAGVTLFTLLCYYTTFYTSGRTGWIALASLIPAAAVKVLYKSETVMSWLLSMDMFVVVFFIDSALVLFAISDSRA